MYIHLCGRKNQTNRLSFQWNLMFASSILVCVYSKDLLCSFWIAVLSAISSVSNKKCPYRVPGKFDRPPICLKTHKSVEIPQLNDEWAFHWKRDKMAAFLQINQFSTLLSSWPQKKSKNLDQVLWEFEITMRISNSHKSEKKDERAGKKSRQEKSWQGTVFA